MLEIVPIKKHKNVVRRKIKDEKPIGFIIIMNNRFSKLGIICCSVYLSLFLVALMITILAVKESALVAIYMIILTFPWSFIWGLIIIILYFFLDVYDPSTNVSIIILSFFSIVNTVILYKICVKYEKRRNNYS